MNRSIMAVAAALYLIGATIHLEIFQREPGTIWGDAGDGFFNLWVMKHVTDSTARGEVQWADARIFWPENEDAFFWSDNLMAFAPVFGLARGLTSDLFDAFWWTGLILSALHFGALLFLFTQGYRLVRHRYPTLPDHAAWLIPVFAYLGHFSPATLINYFMHLQNMASLGIILIMGGALAYGRSGQPRWVVLMALAFVSMVCSTPYFAVAGMLIGVTWLLVEIFARGRPFVADLSRIWWLFPVSAIGVIYPVLGYLRVDRIDHLPSDINTFAIEWSDLIMPAYGLTYRLLQNGMAHISLADHEQIAWLGTGLLVGLLVMALDSWRRGALPGAHWLRSPLGWVVVLSLVLLLLKIREFRPFLAWYGLLFIGLCYAGAVYLLVRARARSPFVYGVGFSVLIMILLYGVAFGPHGYYLAERANPSIWGFFSLWLPGFTGMRAVGRMAALGQILLLFLFSVWWWTQRVQAATHRARRTRLMLCIVLICTLQALDHSPVRAVSERFNEALVRPSTDEQDFFSRIEGTLVVFPATPFSRNTAHMLYFSHFPELVLMNGYSGRSTERWDEVMRLEHRHGRGAPEAVLEAVRSGVNHVAFRLDRMSPPVMDNPVFENERWQVFRADAIDPEASAN